MSDGDTSGPQVAGPSNVALRNVGESGNEDSSTTTQRSNSFAGTPITPSNSGGTNSTAENERLALIKELEEVIESFRARNIARTDAVAQVLGILGKDTTFPYSKPQKEATFGSYLTEILSIQSTFDRMDTNGGNEEAPSNFESGNKKRMSGPDSDSEDEDDKSHKRTKLLESDMPWFVDPGQSTTRSSNPSCQETCRLLRAYNRDIAKAKFFVKIAPNSPSGIPASQWERILKGEAVDLNQIFASLHNVIPDEERTGRLGDTEISFGVAEAKKRIRTASEWSSAWKRASKAIVFAFPHQQEELSEYGDYIDSEFAAKLSSSHPRVILYDVALKNEVAAGQHFLLTDVHRFTRLYSAIVLPDGIEGHSDQPPGKKPSGGKPGSGKPEICNKYNAGTCKRSDSECKYSHLCKNCRKTGHGKKDCPDDTK